MDGMAWPLLIVSAAGGILLGLLYFGSLWWVVRRLPEISRPGLWVPLSTLVANYVGCGRSISFCGDRLETAGRGDVGIPNRAVFGVLASRNLSPGEFVQLTFSPDNLIFFRLASVPHQRDSGFYLGDDGVIGRRFLGNVAAAFEISPHPPLAASLGGGHPHHPKTNPRSEYARAGPLSALCGHAVFVCWQLQSALGHPGISTADGFACTPRRHSPPACFLPSRFTASRNKDLAGI